jgi:WD40 repeat protein
MNQIAVIIKKTEEDAAIEVWEPGNRLPLRIVTEIPDTPAFEIRGFAWSANGNRMAFTTTQGRAVVLDADTGASLFDQTVHTRTGGATNGVALSPTADILATGSWFGQIKTWDINTHELIKVILDPPSRSNLRTIAFSPDGSQLAATMRFGRRAVYDFKMEAWFDYDPVANGSLGRIQWCADGRRFAATDEHKVAVYERGVVAPIAVFTHRDVCCVCWVDDTTLASGGKDQTIRLWDLQKRHQVRSLRVDRGPSWHVEVSHDGQFLASEGGRSLKVVRLNKRLGYHDVLEPADRQSGTTSIVRWSRDGRRIAVKSWPNVGPSKQKATLRIHDLQTSQTIAVHDDIGHGHKPMIDWSADDTFILDIDNNGRRHELGVTDPTMRNIYDDLIQNSEEFHHIAVSHESGLLAVATGNEVRICESEIGRASCRERV